MAIAVFDGAREFVACSSTRRASPSSLTHVNIVQVSDFGELDATIPGDGAVDGVDWAAARIGVAARASLTVSDRPRFSFNRRGRRAGSPTRTKKRGQDGAAARHRASRRVRRRTCLQLLVCR